MQHPSYKNWIKIYTKKYWYLILLLIILSLGAVFFELITPLPLKFLAENVFGKYAPPHFIHTTNKTDLLLIAAIAYAAIYGLQMIYISMQVLIARKCNQYIDKVSLQDSYDAATKIPYNDSSRLDVGTYLYQITNQSQQMSEYVLTNFVSLAQSSLMFIGVIIVLAHINLRIMLITFVIAPLLALCVFYFGKALERKANDTETAHAKVYGFVEESLTKLRTLQAFVLGKKRTVKLKELINVRNKKAVSQLVTSQLYDTSVEFIILTGIAVAIFLGGQSVFAGVMTFGDLLIFIAYTNDVFAQVSSIIQTLGNMKVQAASLQQAYDTVSEATNKQLASGELSTPIIGKIEFKDVTITQANRPVVENVNLTIEPGSVVAFVGLSGSGKTTLLNSLLRFISPDRGWIMLDGHDIKEYDTDYLRQHIALIEQEPDLFGDTVSENIALAEQNREFALLDVLSASLISNSKDFIESLPEKYDTIIDNHKLSGGQKQRLAVARAFYKKAPVVLMDEPTSALDKESARIFVDNIFKYFAGKTTLIITHDLSLLQKIPLIYVVKDHSVLPISQYGGLEGYAQELTRVTSE
jgi:ABC-type multidrug transport system fused ATPase/permease subunit